MVKKGVYFIIIFAFVLTIAIAKEKSKNIVPDGGFEKVKEIIISSNPYIYKAIQNGTELTQEGPFAILPSNFSQFCGCKKLKVIEGTSNKEVHSGKRAILLNGSFYLKARCKAKTGDIFTAKYYAKGKGKVRVILHLTNTKGKYYNQAVPKKVPIDTDKWILIEQKLDTKDKPDLKKIWVRIETKGDVYIDDLSLVKEEK